MTAMKRKVAKSTTESSYQCILVYAHLFVENLFFKCSHFS